MTADWQTILALAVVAVAIGYVGRTAWQVLARRKSAACGGCDHCAAAPGGEAQSVVQIGSAGANGKMAGHVAGSDRNADAR